MTDDTINVRLNRAKLLEAHKHLQEAAREINSTSSDAVLNAYMDALHAAIDITDELYDAAYNNSLPEGSASWPLRHLLSALDDIRQGRKMPPALARRKRMGPPKLGLVDLMSQGAAAGCLDCLEGLGLTRDAAASRVARALSAVGMPVSGRGAKGTAAQTVLRWRDEYLTETGAGDVRAEARQQALKALGSAKTADEVIGQFKAVIVKFRNPLNSEGSENI